MPNSTDAMKDTINTMFAEPINYIEGIVNDMADGIKRGNSLNIPIYLEELQSAINALKSKLPTPQG